MLPCRPGPGAGHLAVGEQRSAPLELVGKGGEEISGAESQLCRALIPRGELLRRVVELRSLNKGFASAMCTKESAVLTDTAAGCIALTHSLERKLVPAGL